MQARPDLALIDMGVGEPDGMAYPGVVNALSEQAAMLETVATRQWSAAVQRSCRTLDARVDRVEDPRIRKRRSTTRRREKRPGLLADLFHQSW